ncbi:MAG: AraC family transcriptional regulator [Acidobacteriota bacterium]
MHRFDLTTRVAAHVDRSGGPEAATGVEGLLAIRHRRQTRLEPMLYRPSLCLILQGRKRVLAGDREQELGPGDAAIISHHLPVLAKIVEAEGRAPFVALALDIDLSLLRELRDEVGESELESRSHRSLEVGRAEEALVEAVARLFDLVDRPVDAKILTPLVRREIHYRVLVADHGGTLRQLLEHRSHASQITRALTALRRDFAQPLSVSELARLAGMSTSSFHEHFKALTATTPLQYQKSLRLLEAKRMLADGTHNVTGAALEVGYQSTTQFSREYSRRFGHSPRQDLP